MRNTIKKLFILSSIFFSQHSFAVLDTAGNTARSHTPLAQVKPTSPPNLMNRVQNFVDHVERRLTGKSEFDQKVEKIDRKLITPPVYIISRDDASSFYMNVNELGMDPNTQNQDAYLQNTLHSLGVNSRKLLELNKLKDESPNINESEEIKFNKVFKEYEERTTELINKSKEIHSNLQNTQLVTQTYRENAKIRNLFETTYAQERQIAQDALAGKTVSTSNK